MTSGRQDRPVRSFPAVSKPAEPELAGAWEGGGFRFKSPQHEEDWRRQAYRQSVRPEGWQAQPPVDHRTQAVLDGMPEVGAGQYFRGPDGKHRRVTAALGEDRDVQQIRQRAFHDFAKTGVTWEQLGAYRSDQPHPGEDEAVAVTQARAGAESADGSAAGPNKMRDMGAPPKNRNAITQVAGDLGLGLGQFKDPSNGQSAEAAPPILVASNDKAGTIPGWLKGYAEPGPVAPARPLPGSQQRRAYNEGLVGHPANDNSRPAANDNLGATRADGSAASIGKTDVNGAAKAHVGTGGEIETDPDVAITDRLFNWSRRGGQPPAPSEFAIHAASDEGRFTYLEEMKDEWSQQLAANPEQVFRSMQGEVEKIANAAQQDFVTSHHRPPIATETAEINDAVTKIVFAPAEHWDRAGDKPNEKVVEAKPFLGVIEPVEMSGSDLSDVFSQAAKIIAEGEIEKFGGRPGSKETRRIIARVVEKLAKAIEACGGKVRTRLYGPDEKFLRSGQATGGSFADKFLEFDYNDKTIGFFGNHAAMYADGVTLKPNEANQIRKLVQNIARGISDGDLEIDAAGVGYFSKRKRGQSMKDYLRTVNDFVKKMVDCKRPFLIKIRIENPTRELPQNDNIGQ